MRLDRYTPGIVDSYDAATRTCRVNIPGLTDGAEVLPQAVILYPVGDKSHHTETRILAGDRVWLDFIGGDPRSPIIIGFRAKETDNAIDWRRWHHANIELEADTDIRILANGAGVLIEAGSQITIRAPSVRIEGDAVCTGSMTVHGALAYEAGISGSGQMRNNGKDVGSGHRHSGIQRGGGNTDAPV